MQKLIADLLNAKSIYPNNNSQGLVVITARNALAAPLQIICVMSEVQTHFILTAHVLPSLVPAVVGR